MSTAPRSAITWLGYGLAATGAILFSTKGILIKLLYAEGLDAETMLALRMIFSLPVYLAIGYAALRRRWRENEPLPSARLFWHAAWVGILGYWLASYFDFLGLGYISAQFERLILFTYPLFVVLFGALFFGQALRLKSLLAFGISYAGLALIFTRNFVELGHDVLFGAGLVLVAAISYALYQLFAKNLITTIGPRLFTCIAMSAAAAVAIAQFFITHNVHDFLISPYAFSLVLMLAIGGTVVPSFLLNAALHHISAQANSTIGTLSPIATVALAVPILKETFTLVDLAGTALVLAGIIWFTLMDRRAAENTKAEALPPRP